VRADDEAEERTNNLGAIHISFWRFFSRKHLKFH